MKKTNLTDKVVIGIIVLDLLSFLFGWIFYDMLHEDGLLYKVVVINYFYILFGIPFSMFAGIMLNITSLIWKAKTKESFKLNVWLLIILLLMLPGWQQFSWQALLSV